MHRSKLQTRLTPLARAIAAAGLLASPLWLQAAPPAANTLPTGLQVGAGQASVVTQGNQMTVRNSNGAILNWSSFNIGAAAGVNFEQANAASKVLNRVTGNDPSQIFGSLTSNGQVWLLNPNGVLFGQGARVDVAGLVTSTLRLNDNDFLNSRFRFTGDAGSTATVRNEGSIRSAHGGQVLLLGAKVENTGSVEATGGSVTVASARSVELVDTGLPNLAVRVDVPEGEALNMGRLVADGGRVDVFGAIVNQQGLVQADTLAVDAQGRVTLKAGDTLMLASGSTTQARGVAAGTTGGSVDLLGARVGLAGSAAVDASGVAGGGGIRVGGGLQGRDTNVPNAQAVWFGPQASLRADATGADGTGGRIILWSDNATRAYGTLSARGGSASGAGGFVETSGGWLDARPAAVDVSSRSGAAGQWLLDPNNITITSTGNDTAIAGGPDFTSTNDNSVITTGTIAAALNAGTSVSVTTAAAGTNAQAGDIFMDSANLTVAPAQGVTLTLNATRDILVRNSTISSSGQPLNLSLVSAASGQGAIEVLNSSITTAGGNVTLGGANSQTLPRPDGTQTAALSPAVGYVNVTNNASQTSSGGLIGIDIQASTFNLGAGTFRATAHTQSNASTALFLGSATNLATVINAATIELTGIGNPVGGTGGGTPGLYIRGEGTALNATQGLRLEGSGRSGIQIEQGSRLSLAAAAGSGASATITGYSSAGNAVEFAADNFGAGLPGTGTRLTVSNASLDIVADSTSNAALVMVNDNGAPGPLMDLAAATSATFRVNRSAVNADWGNFGMGIANVDLVLPVTAATLFTADLGVGLFQSVVTAGSGTVTFSGQSVGLINNLLTGNGSAFEFITTGANPLGVALSNTTLITGNGDVRFGALQNVSSSVLGTTTVPARWVEYAGTATIAALSLNGSTIDAGTGSIVGGGANRSSALGGGVEVFQSNLSARTINLAGRSDDEIGLLVDGSTLFADRVLKLDGLSGSSQNNDAGLYVFQASTLQVADAAANTGSQLALSGKNIAGHPGVVLEGGDAGTANETRLIVSGAALDIRGDGPVAGGVGVLITGTQAVPGGLLINALGATSATIDGSTSTGAGGGLAIRYANLLGPQATTTAPMVLRASGTQVNGAPALGIDRSTVTTGGTLSVEGDGVIVTSSGLTGENGLFLRSNATAAAGPIQIDQSILSTSAAGAQMRFETTGGGAAVGSTALQSGTGVAFTDSGMFASGAGASIVVNGQGAASGGTGVSFVRSVFQAPTISLTGVGSVVGDGVFGEDTTGGRLSQLAGDNITISGTGADNTAAPSKVGVRLGANVQLAFGITGGTGLITGDTILLGNIAGTAPGFSITGSPDTFSVRSADSLRIINSSIDFLTTGRSGTVINVLADSDATGGGRARIENSLLQSGGANITVSGQGVVRNPQTVPQNITVREGAIGVFLIDSTISMGSGTATITGSGPVTGATQGANTGLAGVVAQGANTIFGGQIVISGDGGDYGAGIDVGINQAGAALQLQANSISLTGRGTGIDPNTGQIYAGVQVASTTTNNWTVLNPGTGLNTAPLAVTSTAGPVTLSNVNISTGRLNVTAPAALTLSGSIVAAADSLVLSATGASVNGSLLSTLNTSLTAGGALQISGTSTDTGVGVMLLDGTNAVGSTATVNGQSTGGPGVWLNSSAGNPVLRATTGALAITGSAGTTSGVRITGGWQLQSGTTLLVDSTEAPALEADGLGALPNFLTGTDTTFRLAPALPISLDATTAARFTTALQNLPATGRLTWEVGGSSDFTAAAALSVPGRMSFEADRVTLQPGALLQASGAGDALVFRGQGGAPLTTFTNTGGAGVLSAPNGRWVILADRPTNTTLGGLQPDFTAYNLVAQPWTTNAGGDYNTQAAGNALGFGVSTAALNGQGLSGLISRTYDATTALTLNPTTWTVTGLNAGDTLSFTGSSAATMADKNVGTAKPVTLNGSTVFSVTDTGGRPVFGYDVPVFTANIAPLSVALSGATVAAKVYDGTTSATMASLGTVTALPGDTLGVGGSVLASFADRNVGTGKTVAVSGFALTGADAGNYTLAAPSSLTADITARALAVTGLAAQSRAYDTTTAATLTGNASLTNAVAGDSVTLAGTAAGSFADKNVGTAKPVSISGLALAGADAGNYTVSQPAGLTADITPASLALSGLTAQSKVYDTTRTAGFLGTASVAPLAGDSVALAGTATGSFADKNAGSNKPVTLSGLALTGADAANYTLAVPAYTANIAPASLGLQNVTAAVKTYDSTRTATVTGTLTGVLAGDAVNVSFSGLFSDANVGTNKVVTWTASTAGPDAGNYILAPAIGAAQSGIAPATLSYVANTAVGTVGQPLPALGGTVSGLVGTDTLASATTGTATWTTTATTASTVGAYAITGAGLSALNYVFIQAAGNATALQLQAPTTADATTTTTTVVTTAALLSVQLPVTMSNPTQGRVLDVTTAFAQPGSASDGVAFRTSTGDARDGGAAPGAAAATGAAGPAATAATGSAVPGAAAAAPTATAAADGGTATAASSGAPGVPSVPLSVEQGRAVALRAAGEAADGITFRALDLSRLPRDEVQSLLAARARYKQKVFSKGVYRLQQDPSLADVRACTTEAELETGLCIITEQLKQQIQAARAQAAQAAQANAPRRDRARRAVKTAALPVIERKLALLIGVNEYLDKQVPELVGAVPDARAVRQVLEQRLGYETTVLENPAREAIVKAFNRLALEAEPNDSVIVYYAGHGVLVPVDGVETGFWLPSDVDSETPKTWLANADIARMVAAVGARQLMLVSDSCYSGQLVGKDRVAASGDVTELLKRRAAVVMSSGGDEPVADQGREGHSVFAWHFMRALEGLDQWQVGGSLYDRVRAGVVKDFPQTPQYGSNRAAGHQGNTDYLFERRELESLKP